MRHILSIVAIFGVSGSFSIGAGLVLAAAAHPDLVGEKAIFQAGRVHLFGLASLFAGVAAWVLLATPSIAFLPTLPAFAGPLTVAGYLFQIRLGGDLIHYPPHGEADVTPGVSRP